MASWYIIIDDDSIGPFSGAQLKQLAASGRLEPETSICKETNGNHVTAASLKKLFVSLDEIPPTPPPLALPKKRPAVTKPRNSSSLLGKMAYPVLILVLLSVIGTSGMLVQQWQRSQEASVLVTAANQEWVSGSKEDAVARYKAAIQLIPAKSVSPNLIERVVNHEIEIGRGDSSKELLVDLLQQGASFQFDSGEASAVLEEAKEAVKAMLPRDITHVSLSSEALGLVESSDSAYLLTVQSATPETSRMDSLEDPIFVGDEKRKLFLRQGGKGFLYDEKPAGSGKFDSALNYGQLLLKSEFSVRGEDRNIFTPVSFYGERLERFPGSFQQFEIMVSVFDNPDKEEFDCHIRQISILTVTDSLGHGHRDPPIEFFFGGTARRLK